MGGQNGNRRSDSRETLLTTPTHVKKIVVGNGIGIVLLVINIHSKKKKTFHLVGFEKQSIWGLVEQNANLRSDSHQNYHVPPPHD